MVASLEAVLASIQRLDAPRRAAREAARPRRAGGCIRGGAAGAQGRRGRGLGAAPAQRRVRAL
eukprot:5239229-Alexandrium_andersonii.AAC.1